MRKFHQFEYKKARYCVCGDPPSLIFTEITRQRNLIEKYIQRHPEFATTLKPIPIKNDAPEIVIAMAKAADLTGVGPMAAVAGSIAEFAANAGMGTEDQHNESIVENGGDIFMITSVPLIAGLFFGISSKLNNLIALSIKPEETPLALCSSSGIMGHSLSFGKCDCVTIAGSSGSIADAVATAACNQVQTTEDITPALEWISSVPTVRGALIAINNKIGICGNFPELIAHTDPFYKDKITHDASWEPFIAKILL